MLLNPIFYFPFTIDYSLLINDSRLLYVPMTLCGKKILTAKNKKGRVSQREINRKSGKVLRSRCFYIPLRLCVK